MLEAFVILSGVSLVLLIMAVVILIGKGDSLIAGYNTASRKAQDVYDKKRVRILVGVLLIAIALALPACGLLLVYGYKEVVMTVFPAAAFVLITAAFVLSHFWVKKK